jgi:hypothetical protein
VLKVLDVSHVIAPFVPTVLANLDQNIVAFIREIAQPIDGGFASGPFRQLQPNAIGQPLMNVAAHRTGSGPVFDFSWVRRRASSLTSAKGKTLLSKWDSAKVYRSAGEARVPAIPSRESGDAPLVTS